MNFIFALVLSGFSLHAAAQHVPAADAAAIKAVIAEQIEAFRRDDGPRAFSLATPAIRLRFGTPETFLYPMQRQPDGTWRIGGCQLARVPGRET